MVELLLVIAIIGTLLGLLLPTVQTIRESARRSHCLNNVKQIGLALHNYHDVHRTFPPGETQLANGQPGHAWSGRLLPFLEQSSIEIDYQHTGYPSSPAGWISMPVAHYRALTTSISVYLCPSSTHAPTFNYDGYPEPGLMPPIAGSTPFALWNALGMLEYQGIAGSNRLANPSGDEISNLGVLFRNSATRFRHIEDGASKTIVVGEYSHLTQYQKFNAFQGTGDSDGTWDIGVFPNWIFTCKTIAFTPFSPAFWPTADTYEPEASALILSTVSRAALKSGHRVGIHIVLADGSARFLSSEVDLTLYQNLADRADGELGGDF